MINKKSKFRVILTNQKSAQENMAIDDALLSSYKNEDRAILRLYTWDNSFTIGVSQDFSKYNFCDDFKGNHAKRITGGGVLFHGHDLSYSLVIPASYLEEFNIKESYENICSFILDFYKKLGLNAMYAKDDINVQLSKSEYCQVGFEAYDILANGTKIGGNAQRRTKKAIFQHGSIPIKSVKKSNTFSKEIGATLEDLDIHLEYDEAKKILIQSFEDSFNVEIEYSTLTKEEEDKKNLLLKDKYDYARK